MKLINWATNPNNGGELIRLPDFDIAVDPNDTNIRPPLVKNKVWEPRSSEQLKRILKPHDVFVDCGAHWGYYTLLASRLGAKVVAFEPNGSNFLLLSVNIVLNNPTNVIALPLALWSNSQMLPFLVEGGTTGGSHIQRLAESVKMFQIATMVPATSLDEIMGDERVDFIKIDCEGSDSHVLQGAKRILKEQKPTIMAEHPYVELLESLDYRQTQEFKDEQTTFWAKV